MRHLSTLFLIGLLFLLAPPSNAQTESIIERAKAEAAEADAVHQELVNLEQETVRALQWNTGTFFRRVYSEDFIATTPTGQILDKQAFITFVERSDAKYSSFIASDVRVRVYQDMAVVTCLWSARGSLDGRAFSRQSRVIHVYTHGQRGWHAIASQETLLPG